MLDDGGLGDCQAGKDCSVERGIFFVWVAPVVGWWDVGCIRLAVCAANGGPARIYKLYVVGICREASLANVTLRKGI